MSRLCSGITERNQGAAGMIECSERRRAVAMLRKPARPCIGQVAGRSPQSTTPDPCLGNCREDLRKAPFTFRSKRNDAACRPQGRPPGHRSRACRHRLCAAPGAPDLTAFAKLPRLRQIAGPRSAGHGLRRVAIRRPLLSAPAASAGASPLNAIGRGNRMPPPRDAFTIYSPGVLQ